MFLSANDTVSEVLETGVPNIASEERRQRGDVSRPSEASGLD
jgi:hypothetical protein